MAMQAGATQITATDADLLPGRTQTLAFQSL